MWKKSYELYSLMVGASAVLVLVYGIFLNLLFGLTFQLYEPIKPIAIIEIIAGISVMPYYFQRFKKNIGGKKWKKTIAFGLG